MISKAFWALEAQVVGTCIHLLESVAEMIHVTVWFCIEEADEYLQPLKELEEARQRRIQTAGIYNSAVLLYVLIQLPFFSELQCSCKVSW